MRRLAIGLAVLAAGCGGGDGGDHASRARRPAAPRPRAAVTITAPRPHGRVTGVPLGDGTLRARVGVSGKAAPGQQLSVGSECPPRVCDVITFADDRGRWKAALRVVVADDARRVTLEAAYAEPGRGEPPATTEVRLVRPRPRALTGVTGGGEKEVAPYSGPRTLIVIGDSLAVGMAQLLAADLPGWRVTTDGRIGRPLAEGMSILARTSLPSGVAGDHTVLAFSLFTNDSPTALDALARAVRTSVARLGSHGCALWATITRPPLNGVSYDRANALLDRLASEPSLTSRLLIVPWAELIAEHPKLIGPDGVHPTPAGYQARAQLYAQAARLCVS